MIPVAIYLMGFVIGAFVTGLEFEDGDDAPWAAFAFVVLWPLILPFTAAMVLGEMVGARVKKAKDQPRVR